MWISVDKVLTNTDENVFLGLIYVPPTQLKYFNDEELLNLEREITSLCSKHKYLFIIGDVNARTAMPNDNTSTNTFLTNFFLFRRRDPLIFDKTSILALYGIPIDRISSDVKTNNNEIWLIEICKIKYLFYTEWTNRA